MLDPFVAVEDGEGEQDRADLPSAEEGRGRLRRGGRADGHPVTLFDAVRGEQVGGAVGERLLLGPAHLPLVAAEVLEDHRRAIAGLAIADVGRDVVALGHLPAMRLAGRLIGEGLGCAHDHTPPGSYSE